MWKNTSRSVINVSPKKTVQAENSLSVNNRIRKTPPFRGVDFILPGGLGGFAEYGADISEITYLTVLRVLSEAMGKLPVHVRNTKHKIVRNATEKLLTVRPNESMTPAQLFAYLEYCRNHYGNGYAFCDDGCFVFEYLACRARNTTAHVAYRSDEKNCRRRRHRLGRSHLQTTCADGLSARASMGAHERKRL